MEYMAALYKEIPVGATAYPGITAPSMSVPWEPQFHVYHLVGGASGSDMFLSYDGINDHLRVPNANAALTGLTDAFMMPVSYRSVWLRSAAGITGTLGCGFYTRQ